jgi:hypothetical protein
MKRVMILFFSSTRVHDVLHFDTCSISSISDCAKMVDFYVQTPCPLTMLHNVQSPSHTQTLSESYFDLSEGGGIGTIVAESPSPVLISVA